MPRRNVPAQVGKPGRPSANRSRIIQHRAVRNGEIPKDTPPDARGRPCLLADHRRGWLLIETMGNVIALGGTDALAARAMGINPQTFREWKQIGENDFELLKDTDRESVEIAVGLYLASNTEGKDTRPLRHIDEEIVSRFAKFAAVYVQAERMSITAGLAQWQVHARNDYRALVGLFDRKFPEEFGQPVRQIAGPGNGPIPLAGDFQVRVKSVVYSLPSNGYEPYMERTPEDIAEDVADDQYWDELQQERAKAEGRATKRAPAKQRVKALTSGPVKVVEAPTTPPDQPDTPTRSRPRRGAEIPY